MNYIAKNPSERMSRQAIETLNEVKDDVKHGDMIHAFNRMHITDGICPTLTTRPEGFKTASLVVEDIHEKESDNLTNIKRKEYDFKPFTFIDLFAGVGGFRQALDSLGGTCVFSSEIDKFAAQAYETLYGEKPAGDITKIDAKDIPEHDLLVGGFPYS